MLTSLEGRRRAQRAQLMIAIVAGLVGLAIWLGLAGANRAWSQFSPGDAQRGRTVAERACASCHAIALGSETTRGSDVPSFAAIAKREKVSAEYLAGRIIIPHPPMPDTSLTVREIRDVIAYILSVKPGR